MKAESVRNSSPILRVSRSDGARPEGLNTELSRLGRRGALNWITAALAAFPALDWNALGATPNVTRTLSGPDLLNPGTLWPRTLTAAELKTVAALCDIIIPADDQSPSASKVRS